VQDARDLGHQLVPRLGDPHVAHLALASGRVRPVGLWHRAWLLSHIPLSQLSLPRPLPPFFSSYSTTSYNRRRSYSPLLRRCS
jgi:hypothetical protein